jgi:hypothetical protein
VGSFVGLSGIEFAKAMSRFCRRGGEERFLLVFFYPPSIFSHFLGYISVIIGPDGWLKLMKIAIFLLVIGIAVSGVVLIAIAV